MGVLWWWWSIMIHAMPDKRQDHKGKAQTYNARKKASGSIGIHPEHSHNFPSSTSIYTTVLLITLPYGFLYKKTSNIQTIIDFLVAGFYG